jgi:rod shape-determining protein MreD
MRNRVVGWIAVFLAFLALQGTVVPFVGICAIVPDLVMVGLFVFALKYGVMPALYVGFGVGLCQDLYSPALLGQNALAKTVTGYATGMFNERVMNTDPLMKIAILVLAFALHDAVFYTVEAVSAGSGAGTVLRQLMGFTLPRAVYSAVLAAAYYLWQQGRSRPLQG